MNRRAFDDWMARELARLDRYGGSLGFAVLDVDHFKSVNDRHGHGGGDRVLVAIAAALRATLRTSDIAARWGGEEFVIALPEVTSAQARIACERVRTRIEELNVAMDDGDTTVRTSVSIGVADARAGESIEQLVSRTDAAMYRAKAGGRNRVELDGMRSDNAA
jgi:diguanylate cyclase (GGDEF)-like protein